MRVTSANVERFRGLRRIRLFFKPGVNVLAGDNGSGKTSVLLFLGKMLGAWGADESCEGTVVCEHNGESYTVSDPIVWPPEDEWDNDDEDDEDDKDDEDERLYTGPLPLYSCRFYYSSFFPEDRFFNHYYFCPDHKSLQQGVAMVSGSRFHGQLPPVGFWQGQVSEEWHHFFPDKQFIITTHSPIVLSYTPADHVWVLKEEEGKVSAVQPQHSKGLSAGRILEDILEVTEQPKEYRDRLSMLYAYIDQGETVQAEKLIEELGPDLGWGSPERVKAQVLLRKKRAPAK